MKPALFPHPIDLTGLRLFEGTIVGRLAETRVHSQLWLLKRKHGYEVIKVYARAHEIPIFQHPNLVPIHETGTICVQPFERMPYYSNTVLTAK